MQEGEQVNLTADFAEKRTVFMSVATNVSITTSSAAVLSLAPLKVVDDSAL